MRSALTPRLQIERRDTQVPVSWNGFLCPPELGMSRTYLVVLVLAGIIASTPACNGDTAIPSDAHWEAATRPFGVKIGYDQARQKHVVDERIAYDWKDAPVPSHLKDWTRVNFSTWNSPAGAPQVKEGWEWGYSNGKDGMEVKVTAFLGGGHASLDAIRGFALRSSMPEPPWEKGPGDLGTLSIQSDSSTGFSVYWAYRDLMFAVEGTSKEEVLKTAYWLTNIAEAHRRKR